MSDKIIYNGIIYTIRCTKNNNLIYVGSTTKLLNTRWEGHKKNLNNKNKNNTLLYTKIKEIGIDNFYIQLYEELLNCTKKELLNREGEIIMQIGTLNKQIPGTMNDEEYKN